jgi:HEAT repeat protein
MFGKHKKIVNDFISRILSTANAEPQTDGVIDSSKTVSWKALREAETLTDEKLIPHLIARIENEPDKKARGAAYFVLGKICKNNADGSAAQFLIDRAAIEEDRYIASSIYDRLADVPKPKGTDLSSLIDATRDSDWLLRHSAIRALSNCEDDHVEEVLMAISDEDGDPFDITYANSVLNKYGTKRAIPTLEKHLQSRKRDIRESAKLAIEEILKRTA